MGGQSVNIAICDSGPIIHLSEINHIFLFKIFDKVLIPSAVQVETFGQDKELQNALSTQGSHVGTSRSYSFSNP